jgi:hypothetical protein
MTGPTLLRESSKTNKSECEFLAKKGHTGGKSQSESACAGRAKPSSCSSRESCGYLVYINIEVHKISGTNETSRAKPRNA